MSATKIKAELSNYWASDPVVPLCMKILDFVARLPEDQSQMLTFRTLSEGVGRRMIDDEFMRALAILVSSNVAALDTHALLVDDDETEHEIDPDELGRARETGRLVHPMTGDLVADFESRVIPFFAPSAKLLSTD